jgi:hypothetical protein
MSQLEEELDSFEHGWKAPDRCMRYVFTNITDLDADSCSNATYRCLAHIVHLAAKHIIQAFSQDSPVMESDFPVDAPADLDEDSETLYVSGDTLGTLWAFINQVCGSLLCTTLHSFRVMLVRALQSNADLVQVRLSPQVSSFFFKCCAEEGLPRLELIKYVRTRWSSMYDLLEQAFLLKAVRSQIYCPSFLMNVQGITKFIQLADDSTQVPTLQKKCYTDYRLTPAEWTKLGLLHQILTVQTMFHDLAWSGSNLVKTAPHPHSTSVLFRTCSHRFPHFPNHRVPTHVPGGCREGDRFCTDSKCHNSWHFESHQVVSKA